MLFRRFVSITAGALICATVASSVQSQDRAPDRIAADRSLKTPADFAAMSDKTARSKALFNEAAKVLTDARCMNCHPAGDHPLQGADRREHKPVAWRGEIGAGVAGLPCSTCHTNANVTLVVGPNATYRSIPGNPRWGLAPPEMAWEGKSVGDICRQLKDRERNGGRDLALIHEHVAKDELVGWGWTPGEGRQPAPGTQAQLGELIQAWIDTGAECP